VLKATQRDGSVKTFSGCYVLRRTNDGVSPDPQDLLWRIYAANLREVPGNIPTDDLLAQPCER
jgi:hypothetical protein